MWGPSIVAARDPRFQITVEFDHRYNDANAYKLVPGDHVTVTGKIDDGWFQERTIAASSAYVHSINTYYHATAADEKNITNFTVIGPPVDGMHTVVQGTVTSIPKGDAFRIMAGTRILTVEVDEMSYNPLDDEGYQNVKIGDRVSVSGNSNLSQRAQLHPKNRRDLHVSTRCGGHSDSHPFHIRN